MPEFETPRGPWSQPRDPGRIPVLLQAIEREWMKNPDLRLGQLLMNVLRRHTSTPSEDEGRMLSTVEDTTLLDWLERDQPSG